MRRGFGRGAGEGRKIKERQMREEIRNRARSFPQVHQPKGSRVRGTSKQVSDCLRFQPTRWTERVRGSANSHAIFGERRAVAGSELGQSRSVGSWEGSFFLRDGRGGCLKQRVCLVGSYGVRDGFGMESLDGRAVVIGRERPIDQVGRYGREKFGLQSLFHISWS